MCRKNSGSAYATYGGVLPSDFKWLTGEKHIKVYQSSVSAERGFCEICGSSLYFKLAKNNSSYEIALGTLDEEPNQVPNANIFCSSKAKWSIEDEKLQDFQEDRV